MNISHLKKEYVLAALYNASRVQGMGVFQAKNGIMTPASAATELDQSPDK